MAIERITLPSGLLLARGSILRVTTADVCASFKVASVRLTSHGAVLDVVEVAGVLAVEPSVAHYEAQIRRGVQPKVAEAATCKRFRIHRATLHRRRARQ
jgi:hypothetical protein